MNDLYKNKVEDLTRENVKLRENIKSLRGKLYEKLGMHFFYTKNVEKYIEDFILSCKDQLQVITSGFDMKFFNNFQKLANEGKKVQIITLERHQLMEQESIKAFDLSQGSSINIYTNHNVRSNILIKDTDQVLISSTRLLNNELIDALNFCIISMEKQVVEQFQNYFNIHLPKFLRP